MCGRYSLTATAELVDEVFGADAGVIAAPRWNISPTEPAPVVRLSSGTGRRIDLLRWGFALEASARSSSAAAARRLLINARSETVADLASFREALAHRRCLVPADGFYEWGPGPGGRTPYHIRLRDRRLFAMAGLWNPGTDSGASAAGSFTILTCPPNDVVRPLHDRMPVILPPRAWNEWLTGRVGAALEDLLLPWDGEAMEAAPVGPYVNRAGNEGPECWAAPPAPPPAQRSLFP